MLLPYLSRCPGRASATASVAIVLRPRQARASSSASLAYLDRLRVDGFARLDCPGDRADTALAAQVHAEVMDEHARLGASWAYTVRRFFDTVNNPAHRHSFPVPMTPAVRELLADCLHGSPAKRALFNAMVGPSGTLVELSALVTLPGAHMQNLHSDIPYNALPLEEPCGLASVFVALQDIPRELGPTIVLPGTHQHDFHKTVVTAQETYNAEGEVETVVVGGAGGGITNDSGGKRSVETPTFSEEEVYDGAVLCVAGDIFIMDSRTVHAGGANDAERGAPRAVLCLAFQRDPSIKARGFTYHIHPDVKGRYTLADFA